MVRFIESESNITVVTNKNGLRWLQKGYESRAIAGLHPHIPLLEVPFHAYWIF